MIAQKACMDKIMLGLANYVLFAINRKKMEKAMY